MKKVTIAIPTYKRPDLLILSLQSAINQRGEHVYDILILDDDPESCLNEDIRKLISRTADRVSIRYIVNDRNMGIYGNWNRCIEECSTEFITILNDDDLLEEEYLNSVLPLLELADLIAVDAFYIDEPVREYGRFYSIIKRIWQRSVSIKNRINPLEEVKLNRIIMGHPYVASLGVLFRNDIARSIGGFNSKLYPSSDYDFFIRYWEVARCLKLRRNLASYRFGYNISLKTETLVGWLKQDREIKTSLATRRIKPMYLPVVRYLIDFQSNVSAQRYQLMNPDFIPSESLASLGLPFYRLTRFYFIQNLSSVLWKCLLPRFTNLKV